MKETKYDVDDMVAVNGVVLKIVAITKFGNHFHYGVNFRTPDNTEYTSHVGWIPAAFLDINHIGRPYGDYPTEE